MVMEEEPKAIMSGNAAMVRMVPQKPMCVEASISTHLSADLQSET